MTRIYRLHEKESKRHYLRIANYSDTSTNWPEMARSLEYWSPSPALGRGGPMSIEWRERRKSVVTLFCISQ